MTAFNKDDDQGVKKIVSNNDVVVESDRDQDGVGDFIVRTGGVERTRVKADGTGSGWLSLVGVFNVRDTTYGAKGDGVADDSAAINAAITAAGAAGGGVVYFPRGTYLCLSTLSVTVDDIEFAGAGRKATTIKKGADINLIDVLGSHATTTTTAQRKRFTMRSLRLDGGSSTLWTKPLLRLYYSTKGNFVDLDFDFNFGCAIQTVEAYDSYFYNCRFDTVGGTDGTKPAFNILQTDGAVSGIGHSTDNSNNMWLVNCVFESFRDGALWITGTGSGALRCNQFYFVNVKMETVTVRGPFIKIAFAEDVNFVNLDTSNNGFDSGYSTAADLITVVNTNNLHLTNWKVFNIAGGVASCRTYLSATGSNSGISIDDAWFAAQTTNKPTVAALEFTGTNTRVSLQRYGYYNNPGAAALFSGNPTVPRVVSENAAVSLPGVAATLDPRLATLSQVAVANEIRAVRVTIPYSGVLHDLSVYVTGSSGNGCFGIYDTGDALAASASLLYSTGSIAFPATGAWRTVGDPSLAVTAGQQVDFFWSADNTTAAIMHGQLLNAGAEGQLPTSFAVAAGGLSPKLAWLNATFPAPGAVAEANRSQSGRIPCIIARIV